MTDEQRLAGSGVGELDGSEPRLNHGSVERGQAFLGPPEITSVATPGGPSTNHSCDQRDRSKRTVGHAFSVIEGRRTRQGRRSPLPPSRLQPHRGRVALYMSDDTPYRPTCPEWPDA